MAKPNYQFEKRQRDMAKKAKQEEKRRQKLADKAGGNAGDVADTAAADDATATATPTPSSPETGS